MQLQSRIAAPATIARMAPVALHSESRTLRTQFQFMLTEMFVRRDIIFPRRAFETSRASALDFRGLDDA